MIVPTVAISGAGNLPAPLTSFVGRRQEVAEVCRALGTARLLTLTGAGGVGKTRLALEAAAESCAAFPDGAWIVDLTSVRGAPAVADAVAAALGLPDLGTLPVIEQLAGYLAGRRALVVLDNCEHLVDACAQLAKTLLSAAAGLRVVATSRQTLDITGERVFPVSPLSADDAVDLLRDRAAAVRPDFRITDANRAQVVRLCGDLDGLPLAIELAAARLRTLSVGQAADRLEDRFALLTGGRRRAPLHQRTLRETIDWSHELCDPAERLLWRRLSVFAGGFGLEAAETVCAGDGIARAEVLDLLDRLVAQSVVLPAEAEGLPRYRLLESLRLYGRERLADSGEEERLRLRHRDFFLALAERFDRDWAGSGQVEGLALLRAEHRNLLAALDCAFDPEVRLALVVALCFHWCVGGFLGEGRRQFERALAEAPEPTPARARALVTAAWTALSQGDTGVADRWLDEAQALGEQFGDPTVSANVAGFRGVSAHYQGRIDDAITGYETARAALTALGDERGAGGWILALACVQAYSGDPRAEQTCGRLIAASEASGERWGRAQVLMALAFSAWERGSPTETRTLARAALENMRGFNDYAAVARMLEVLAWATAAAGEYGQAARLLGTTDALWRDAGTAVTAFDPRMAEYRARCEAAVSAALGAAPFAKASAKGGLNSSPGQAINFVLETGTGGVPDAPATAPSPLSRREQQVAALVAEGMSNRQIAAELVLSPRTVDRHIDNIRGKLGFVRRTQIAAWWAAHQPPQA
ncbi:ATP-binding protein [Streptomyces sp. NPDC048179]|uniref:ATP-binding protein n=1 Tax=Streptomyces sp. NPDC048179 TaxID=3365506 RepID=UPI00371DD7E8